jgi:hypothetical protein
MASAITQVRALASTSTFRAGHRIVCEALAERGALDGADLERLREQATGCAEPKWGAGRRAGRSAQRTPVSPSPLKSCKPAYVEGQLGHRGSGERRGGTGVAGGFWLCSVGVPLGGWHDGATVPLVSGMAPCSRSCAGGGDSLLRVRRAAAVRCAGPASALGQR